MGARFGVVRNLEGGNIARFRKSSVALSGEQARQALAVLMHDGKVRRAIHVSSGGLSPDQNIPLGPSYQVPLARAVKAATKMPVIAVGIAVSVANFAIASAVSTVSSSEPKMNPAMTSMPAR